ncbi:MAG: response regulator [Planctomycetota bacterium]
MDTTIRLLLVDDEEIVGKRLKVALEKHGYAVEVARSGRSAIERLQSQEFDVVITDLRLDDPDGLDGLDVLDAVQEHSPRTKTILITGYATAEVARGAVAKGAFDFIAKPFKPKDLRELIENAVRAP